MSVIKVKNLHKSFRMYHDRGLTLKERLLFKGRNKYVDNVVLSGIDFELEKGETLGLIGKNGSGKSTLLKILTKIIYPDTGKVTVSGRVSSLLELGAGFHPDMTGRENIYINASIFGLSKKEIDDRLDDIIAFSELEDFIDVPVRTYSSGMYMRLAFAVAINVDADVMLIDEILAVGDASFQSKCFQKLGEIKKKGCTIVIVTHDMGAVKKFCDRAIWLHEGIIYRDDKPHRLEGEYYDVIMHENKIEIGHNHNNEDVKPSCAIEEGEDRTKSLKDGRDSCKEAKQKSSLDSKYESRYGDKSIEILDVKMICDGKESYIFETNDKVDIRVTYQINSEEINQPIFGFGFFTADGVLCYGTNTVIEGFKVGNLKQKGQYVITINDLCLIAGAYSLQVAVVSKDHIPYDFYNNCKTFTMYSSKQDIGIVRVNNKWDFDAR